MNKPAILLTNDDGIASPGLLAAAQALAPLGKLVIAAPLTQQTSMGRSYCGNPEARLEPYAYSVDGVAVEAFTCEASPAAVVRHALLSMPGLAPALVVAGVNYGENIGTSVTGSGTVGAAFDAASQGLPALAVSLETDVASHREYTQQDWGASIHFTRFFAEGILRGGMAPGVAVLKIEVPSGASAATLWRLTRLSPFSYYEAALAAPSLACRRKDTIFTKRSGEGEPDDTDAYAVRTAREVAVTPLGFDLTAQTPFADLALWLGSGASASFFSR